MTEKELKKLNRYQLLELLVIQTKRADKLQMQLEKSREEHDTQDLQIAQMGSLAEASLQLSGVFEAAQTAAEMYIEAAKKQAADIIAEAEEKARNIIQYAENEVLYQAIMSEELDD